MYNLRSRQKHDIPDASDIIEEPSKKRTRPQLENNRKKAHKTDNDSFSPKSFKTVNDYNKICDSSDSESDDSLDDIEIDDEGNLDDPFNPNQEEYFDVNIGPLVSIIVNKLKAKFPHLDADQLKEAVKRAIGKARADLVDEYCEAIPKDCSWKAELDSEEVQKLEPELKQLRKNIKNNTPTIAKILKSGLTSSEKERALRLYDAWNNSEPYTLDHIYLEMRISEILRSAPDKLNVEIDEKLKVLHQKMEESTPTVEKIMAARLTESDKIRALQLYEVLQQSHFNSDDYFDTKRRINSILDAQLETIEDVSRIEAEEAEMKGTMTSFNTDLKRKIFELDADQVVKSRIYEMYCDMISRGVSDSKYSDLKDKILWAIKLPYRKTLPSSIKDNSPESIRTYCRDVYNRLDDEIYGMKDAKEQVVQAVNDRIYNPNSRCILALKGKPGVGKTKLAKTIAKAAGLAFDKISLGGAIDSTIFRGSDNVWSGATPSMLLQILSRVKCSNVVILLDEIDKLAASEKGVEVQNALLHILDPTQNKEFQDSFLSEFPHDISKIWFIPAMNDEHKLDPALRDRLNIVEVPSYTREDMVQIVKKHTLPETLFDKGIALNDITITDNAIRTLLNLLGKEIEDSGMRPVERAVNNIISKLNLLRSLHGDNTLPLTFKLPDFKGFPYTINSDAIKVLHKQIKQSHGYDLMFT